MTKLSPQKKDRLVYIIVFISIFLIIWIISSVMFMMNSEMYRAMIVQLGSKFSVFLLTAFFGYGFSSIFTGVYLFVKFIKNKPAYLKILSGVLFMFTMALIVYGGMFVSIPYLIYNFYKLLKKESEGVR